MSPANKLPDLIAVCVTALILGSVAFPVQANSELAAIEQGLTSQGAQISRHSLTGQVNFIGTRAGNTIAVSGANAQSAPSAVAMDALNAYGMLFGVFNPAAEMNQKSLRTMSNGRSVVRYQQKYNGIPVIGGEMIVNLGANNGLLSINGEVSPKLTLPTQPGITAQQAVDRALALIVKGYQTTASTLTTSTPILSIYDPKLISPDTSPASLVWRIEISSTNNQPIRELVLVDAQNGTVSLHFNQVDTALDRETYTANETSSTPGTLVCDETDPTCAAGDTDAKNAHQYAKDTYDFYNNTHGRDGIDGIGSPIVSTVHWTYPGYCPNAFWDGTQMVYCTGLVVDDVVAHELTHGVTENESNLFYFYQSGAINESLSDMWGEFVDQTNGLGTDNAASRWLMGEDLNVSGLVGAIRNMKNPPAFSDPDRMGSAYYHTSYTDNGGVHINSGVNNKAVYLMVDGDTFNAQTVTGIGITKTAKIYYEVQTNLLTSGANYLDLYNALYQGCQNLADGTTGITIADCNQVRAATNAVEMNQQPSAGFNPDAAMCPTGQGVVAVDFNEDMESSPLGYWWWTVPGYPWEEWTSTSYVTVDGYGPNATSGIESLFGEDVIYASSRTAIFDWWVPAGSATELPYLHFRHDYNFEEFNGTLYDGGVMEYSLDSGANWINASPLIDDGQTTDGTIASASNPLNGESAFGGSSHGYVSTRLDLSGLAGQYVWFRWNVGTDTGNDGILANDYRIHGWWLDDVQIYTCSDVSTFDFSSPSYTFTETGVTATITVNRTGDTTSSVSVEYTYGTGSATAGLDYTHNPGILTFNPGDVSRTFPITISDDAFYEGTETVDLVLFNPSAGAELGSTPVASLAITDDDPTASVSFSGTTYPVAENGTNVTITVNRSGNTAGPASIDYTVTSGTAITDIDFSATSGTLSWTAGDTAAKTFTVTILDDTTYEGNETATLTLSNPVGTLIGTGSATLTIIEDDTAPRISFSTANYAVDENAGTATITLSRSVTNSGAIYLDYSVTGVSATSGTDFVPATGTLSWADGDGANKTFTVSIIDDSAYESDETINLAISSLTGALTGTPATATLTITNDDSKPSSGGGALGWPFLLVGLLLLAHRRRNA